MEPTPTGQGSMHADTGTETVHNAGDQPLKPMEDTVQPVAFSNLPFPNMVKDPLVPDAPVTDTNRQSKCQPMPNPNTYSPL